MKDPFEVAADAGVKLSTFSPRKQAVIMLAASVVLIPFSILVGTDGKAGWLLIIGVSLVPMSLWVLATGRAGTRNEPKAPLWWWVGAIVVAAISLFAGFATLGLVGD